MPAPVQRPERGRGLVRLVRVHAEETLAPSVAAAGGDAAEFDRDDDAVSQVAERHPSSAAGTRRELQPGRDVRGKLRRARGSTEQRPPRRRRRRVPRRARGRASSSSSSSSAAAAARAARAASDPGRPRRARGPAPEPERPPPSRHGVLARRVPVERRVPAERRQTLPSTDLDVLRGLRVHERIDDDAPDDGRRAQRACEPRDDPRRGADRRRAREAEREERLRHEERDEGRGRTR